MFAHHARTVLTARRTLLALCLAQLVVVLLVGPAAASSGGGPFPVR